MTFLRNVCTVLVFVWIADSSAQDYVPGEVIVKLKSQVSTDASYAFMGKAHSDKSMTLKHSWGKMKMHHFSLKAGKSVQDAISELRSDPDVLYAEPNYIFNKASDFEASRFYSRDQMGAIAKTDPQSAYEYQLGVEQIYQSMKASAYSVKPIVAIIDTGIDVTHPVFTESGALWVNQNEIPNNGIDDDGNGYIDDINGWNFAYNTNNLTDDDGHGTHVAGIVLKAGMDINAVPVEESMIQVMALKFLDANGAGTTSDAIEAIYYAVNNGATVLNNSWGGPAYSSALLDAVVFSYQKGVSFVAAAGNSSNNNDVSPMYPANYDVPHIISIAATTSTDGLAYFSNFGHSTVHVGSPGLNIYSTYPGGGFAPMSGTSMAAPYVAGISALMKVESPEMGGYQLKQGLLASSDIVSPLIGKVYTEARVNVVRSVSYASGAVLDPNQPPYSPSYISRELASELGSSGGGCGLVNKLAKDFNGQSQLRGYNFTRGPSTWYILMVLGLILLPLSLRSYIKSRQPVNMRKHDRFSINTSVTMDVNGTKFNGSVSSISLGGVKVDTNAWLEQGGVVSMKISSPDGKDQVEVEGRIVWSEAEKSYGVAFNGANQGVLTAIGQWTQGLKKI